MQMQLLKMSTSVHLFYITLNKIAMERAEQLMGVTMSEPGVLALVLSISNEQLNWPH